MQKTNFDSKKTSFRLNKFLAERLGVSRRQADELIKAKKVKIFPGGKNNEPFIAALGTHIDKNDKVWYNGMMVPFSMGFTYLAINKPVGFVCSKHKQGESPTIYSLLPKKYQNLKTVGRLDKNSSGLILLTNDGDFAFQMTHPKFYKEKIYHILLNRDLQPIHQQMISDYGIDLPDGKSQLRLTHLVSDPTNKDYAKKWEITMSEGRNRQIRRTFEAVGYKVEKLHRVGFGKYQLNNLKPGEFIEISI